MLLKYECLLDGIRMPIVWPSDASSKLMLCLLLITPNTTCVLVIFWPRFRALFLMCSSDTNAIRMLLLTSCCELPLIFTSCWMVTGCVLAVWNVVHSMKLLLNSCRPYFVSWMFVLLLNTPNASCVLVIFSPRFKPLFLICCLDEHAD